jgi:hypothetical protein
MLLRRMASIWNRSAESPYEQERDGNPCTARQQKQIQHNYPSKARREKLLIDR